jgi:hypothetical protein
MSRTESWEEINNKVWDLAKRGYLRVLGKNPCGNIVIKAHLKERYGDRLVITKRQARKLIKQLEKEAKG